MRPDADRTQPPPREAMRWRRRLLREAGLAPSVARAVARDERYDVHELLGLLERGCPPSLALEIVAPLDDRRTPP